MSKPKFKSREIQKDEGRDWTVLHQTSVSLKLVGQEDVILFLFIYLPLYI